MVRMGTDFTRGELYLKLRQAKIALADINAALKLQPLSGYAMATRGEIHEAHSRKEDVIADYRER